MITTSLVDTGISRHIGIYADAIRVPAAMDLVLLSGTPGLRPDGTLPADFADEVRQAWHNVQTALTRAGAHLNDIISARTWLTDHADLPTYLAVRKEFITHQPTYMLAVVPQVIRPEFRLEIEILAAVDPAAAPSSNQHE